MRKAGRTENESVLSISVNSVGKTQICRNVKQKCLTIIITTIRKLKGATFPSKGKLENNFPVIYFPRNVHSKVLQSVSLVDTLHMQLDLLLSLSTKSLKVSDRNRYFSCVFLAINHIAIFKSSKITIRYCLSKSKCMRVRAKRQGSFLALPSWRKIEILSVTRGITDYELY